MKYFLNCILPLLVHEVGNKEDDFICEICARPFPTKAYLRTHMRTHNEKKIKVGSTEYNTGNDLFDGR